jgi:hypothetical protein
VTNKDPIDPKGLMQDAFSMEHLTSGECRSIFLDWALSVPTDVDTQTLIGALLARHGETTDHPMTDVLREGLDQMQTPRRRGGWKSRPRPDSVS